MFVWMNRFEPNRTGWTVRESTFNATESRMAPGVVYLPAVVTSYLDVVLLKPHLALNQNQSTIFTNKSILTPKNYDIAAN